MCSDKHPLHKKIQNMRNHIRHDLRDNLSHESNKGRIERAKFLGVRDGLLVDIAFSENSIKIGKTILNTSEVINFLKYAEVLFTKHVEEAKNKGLITGIEIAR